MAKNPGKSAKPPSPTEPRLTVSLTPELYAEVERLAKRDSRSRGWIIRKAVENLVRDEQPLFTPAAR